MPIVWVFIQEVIISFACVICRWMFFGTFYLFDLFSDSIIIYQISSKTDVNTVMGPDKKLIGIKIIHSLIWLFFVSVIMYIVYSGITGTIGVFTWVAIGLIIGEGAVLLMFELSCPLTVLARKYSESKKHNFDIYLPEWLAQYNKEIFTTIFLIGLVLVLIRVLF